MSYDFPAHESTRKRRRWGCTCGCVMILIILIIAGAVFSYFGLKPHEEVPRYTMMDAEMDGFGVLRINPDDAGASEFMKFFVSQYEKSMNPQTAADADSGKAKVVGVLVKYSKNILSQLVQPEILLYSRYSPTTADESILIAAPLKNRVAGGVIRQFVRENIAAEPVNQVGLAEIYPLYTSETGTSTVLALDTNEMVISDNQQLLTKALGYAREVGRSATPSEDLQWFIDQLALDEPPVGEDLAVAMVNEESRITNMIFVFEDFVGVSGLSERVAAALAAQKLTFSDISGMKLTADLVSADVVKGQLTMYSPNTETATRLATVFTEALPRVTTDDPEATFNLKGTATARGVTVVIDLELSGLRSWIQKLFPAQAQPAAEAQAEAPAAQPTA